jgi:hypothetical protein
VSLRRRIAAELPPRGPARALVIAMLVVGGVVAVGLPGLIALSVLSALRG